MKWAKETLWAPVVHLGTSVLAPKMFLQFSDQLLESGWLLPFCYACGVIFKFSFVWFQFAFPFTVLNVQFATFSHCYSYVFSTLNCYFSSSTPCCLKLKLFNLIFKLPHNLLSTYGFDLVSSSSSSQPCSGLLFHPSWLRTAFLSLFCVIDFMICNSFQFPGCCIPVLFLKCFFFLCFPFLFLF